MTKKRKIKVSPDGTIMVGKKITSDDGMITVENGLIAKGKKIVVKESDKPDKEKT